MNDDVDDVDGRFEDSESAIAKAIFT